MVYALGDDNSFDFAQALLAFFYVLSHFLKGEIPRLSDISLYWVNVKGRNGRWDGSLQGCPVCKGSMVGGSWVALKAHVGSLPCSIPPQGFFFSYLQTGKYLDSTENHFKPRTQSLTLAGGLLRSSSHCSQGRRSRVALTGDQHDQSQNRTFKKSQV